MQANNMQANDAVANRLPYTRFSGLTALSAVVGLLFCFLVGINGLGTGFKTLGGDFLHIFFAATENPFAGLLVGILATTLVQSSSVTTSMIVALCAAPEDPLPLVNAVPMIMGANVGTTVTNTMVSLVHVGGTDGEFRRAFEVATCHDFFNYLTIMLLLPLELGFGFLSKLAARVSGTFVGFVGVSYESPLKSVLKQAFVPIKSLGGFLFSGHVAQAVVMLGCSAALIIVSLLLLVRVMREALAEKVSNLLNRTIGRSGLLGIAVGVVVTMMVQSSSVTTSLLVPFAAGGLITLQQAFPVTLGANVGTTITAFLASLAVSGVNAHVGVEIALVHVLFNVVGILLIYPPKIVRRLPLRAAEALADLAVRSRKWAIVYVVGMFYGVPMAILLLCELI